MTATPRGQAARARRLLREILSRNNNRAKMKTKIGAVYCSTIAFAALVSLFAAAAGVDDGDAERSSRMSKEIAPRDHFAEQQSRENENENRRGVLQHDRVRRAREFVRRHKSAHGRGIAESRDEKRRREFPIPRLHERREEQRGEKAPVKDDRERIQREHFDEDAGEAPQDRGAENAEPRAPRVGIVFFSFD